ncbi:MAG: glycoside hydrolase family 3 C-terminal domain-containing protein [Clostridiaceae bacterium]
MTLEEKASMCSGLNFWNTEPIERLEIPSVMVSDGPHGLRKQAGSSDHLGLNESIPSTCFPSGVALASSWDRELISNVGSTIAKEAKSEQVSVLLGPAVNIKRSPLCGRNFEYFSEDPYQASQMAKHHILGVQKQGIGTSIKHFAVNNQEYKRFSVDALIDERTLREIYLASFETAIIEAKPWTVMSAYNKVNGTYCSEHDYLLKKILREEWCYEGVVVTDWGANNNRVEGVKASQDLEMPGINGDNDKKIVEAIKNGELEEYVLDATIERLLKFVLKAQDNIEQDAIFNKEQHHDFARKVASECMVLLKNEEDILPLTKGKKIVVIGELAEKARYQGGGSSHINPTFLLNALDEMKKYGDVSYGKGYDLIKDDVNEYLVKQAKELAAKNDVVIIFAGLPDLYESEGYDRKHMKMPPNQNSLIEELSNINENIVVVLSNGSPVEMPWVNEVKGVLEGYLGGQASGGAIADLLYGKVNPSGKLAETFPIRLEDNPSFLNFPGKENKVEYKEGLFVGYRYYDAKKIKTLFPFGYGLSYTSFAYEDIKVSDLEINDTEEIKVSVKIKNTGNVAGKEVVELYVEDIESSVIRPIKELKEFAKVELQPNEEKEITFVLGKRAFAYYNTEISDWHVETGDFNILVGGSSVALPLKAKVKVNSTVKIVKKYTVNSTMGELMKNPVGAEIIGQITAGMAGQFSDLGEDMANMMKEMMQFTTLRMLAMFAGENFTEDMAKGILNKINQE